MITGSEESIEKKLVEFENKVITEAMDEEENDNTNGGKEQNVVYLHILHTQLFLVGRKREASETNKEQLEKKADANKENQQPQKSKRRFNQKEIERLNYYTKHDTVYNNDFYLLATGSIIKVVPHSITEIEDTPSVILEEPGEK